MEDTQDKTWIEVQKTQVGSFVDKTMNIRHDFIDEVIRQICRIKSSLVFMCVAQSRTQQCFYGHHESNYYNMKQLYYKLK